jgi:hypothetical protein
MEKLETSIALSNNETVEAVSILCPDLLWAERVENF